MILQYYNMETNISSNQSQLQQEATGQEVEPKGIVLNRMYTGSYLSTNLGHEVINMFQADNGKHYFKNEDVLKDLQELYSEYDFSTAELSDDD